MTSRPRSQPPPVPPEALRSPVAPRIVAQRTAMATARAVPPPVPPEARRRRSVAPEANAQTHALPISPEAINALVLSARAGDSAAFSRLVVLFRPRVVALALHLTGSRTEAEDIAQDVFLRAFQCLGDFEGRSAFFTWLYRIALNKALQSRQKQRIRQHADLNDPRVMLAVAVDSAAQPQRALELRETYTQLVRAFDGLSPLLRTTVALTTLQGLSYPEAAVVLNTTEGTIAWRMHEARNQLRRALGVPSVVSAKSMERIASPSPGEADPSSYTLAFALASVLSV